MLLFVDQGLGRRYLPAEENAPEMSTMQTGGPACLGRCLLFLVICTVNIVKVNDYEPHHRPPKCIFDKFFDEFFDRQKAPDRSLEFIQGVKRRYGNPKVS